MVLNLGFRKLEERLQKYYESWLEKLISEKSRFVYDTYSMSDNVVVLEKVYQVYVDGTIYLIKVVNHEIVSVRSLYKRTSNEGFKRTDYNCDFGPASNELVKVNKILTLNNE